VVEQRLVRLAEQLAEQELKWSHRCRVLQEQKDTLEQTWLQRFEVATEDLQGRVKQVSELVDICICVHLRACVSESLFFAPLFLSLALTRTFTLTLTGGREQSRLPRGGEAKVCQ
jgi:hypothetical protein